MLYRIRNGLLAIPASVYLQSATAHTRGSKTRSSAMQMHTAIPSFFLQFARGTLYQLTSACCRRTASGLS